MYDDILNNEPDSSIVTKDQVIEAMKQNIKEKEELINQLIDKVAELEDALNAFNEVRSMNKYC